VTMAQTQDSNTTFLQIISDNPTRSGRDLVAVIGLTPLKEQALRGRVHPGLPIHNPRMLSLSRTDCIALLGVFSFCKCVV